MTDNDFASDDDFGPSDEVPDGVSDWEDALARLTVAVTECREQVTVSLYPRDVTAQLDQCEAAVDTLRSSEAADPEDYVTVDETLAALEVVLSSQPGLGGWQQPLDNARTALHDLRTIDPEDA
ncbi:MAG TPA: hypothetical protein VGB75_06070 [Jatrophihabitans sp.]|uniref:hypothetical protein n=1 Tax=Jatrophihabitans sp. TaxID=1932789 RepID=UPI002F12E254